MNVGNLTNKGVEISAYGTPIVTKDWRWDVRANIAWNKNKVKKLADGLDVLSHLTVDNGAASLESHIGEPMGDWYAYTWKTDENGNYIVGDNGLYVTDTSERHKVGNAMPSATGGFGTSLSWKNFQLDVTFDFRIGGDVLNLPWQYMMDAGTITDAVGARDYASGGIFYYSDKEDVSDKGSIHVLSAEEVAKVAKKLLASFPECTRYTKQQVNFWKDLAWHQTVRHAQDWLALHYTSWEPVEGMRAFVEKRPARFQMLRDRFDRVSWLSWLTLHQILRKWKLHLIL